MSKSIYEEAIESLKKHREVTDMIKEIKAFEQAFEQALEQAEKQEKLLKKLQEKIIKLSSFIESSAILKYEDLLMFYKEIKEQLKELENDKKIKN